MKVQVAHSTQVDTARAVAEIAAAFQGASSRFVLYFASPRHDPEVLAREMSAALPGVDTVGCTTAGEIISGQVLDHSIVAMAFGAEVVRKAHFAILPELSKDARMAVRTAFAKLEDSIGASMMALGHSKHVGIVLLDGLSGAEEEVMDEIGNRTDVTFVGGSAGDDLAFKGTHVFLNGKAWSNAGVVVLLEAAMPFEVIKTQSFRVLPERLVATAVDEKRRLVMEFNGRPAVEAYAEAVGTTTDKVHEHFMKHPLGLLVGREPYVRSPQRALDDGIVFYCSILKGMELALLESTNIVEDTQQVVEKAKDAVAMVNFNCILRTLELKSRDQFGEYGRIFAGVPTVGFSTYGEAFLGHINQTATILVFKK